jgi:thioredoxin-like negative regulator of GroEL
MGIEVQTQSKPEGHAVQDASAVPQRKQEAPTAAEVAAQRQKNEAARRLLQEWLADDSGYDEEVWSKVKQLIEENRLSPRKRFCD